MEEQANIVIITAKKVFTSIKEYIPVLYLCLVCIGFIEKGLFYRQFEIDILDYLNIQEMLFMFVPIGSFLITLVFYFFLMVIPIYLFLYDKDKLAKKEKDNVEPKTSPEKNNKINKFKRTFGKGLVIYLILAPLFIFFYLSVILFNRYIGISFSINPLVIFLPMLFYALIIPFMTTSNRMGEDYKKLRKMSIGILTSVLVIFSISILSRVGRANIILNGRPEYSINFEMKGEPIETNEQLIYIGQTSNNIFLRDLKTNSTEIFFKKDINKITLQKIVYD